VTDLNGRELCENRLTVSDTDCVDIARRSVVDRLLKRVAIRLPSDLATSVRIILHSGSVSVTLVLFTQ